MLITGYKVKCYSAPKGQKTQQSEKTKRTEVLKNHIHFTWMRLSKKAHLLIFLLKEMYSC